jgi:hypothetical protein
MIYLKLFEDFYNETYWEKEIDSENIKVTIQEIQDYLKNSPIIKIQVKDIEDMSIHKHKSDKETLMRSQKSNLKYPIIISKGEDGEYKMILDGHHRLKKAIDNNINEINAKILYLKTSPDKYKILFQ